MVDKVVGRVMLTTGLMIFLALFTYQATARTVSIFDVRQNIPLTNDEPVYRDYYINGGTDVGIKNGMTVVVERRVSLHDSFQNQSPGSLVVETGKVKIIHVQENVSVGRLVSSPNREFAPVIENDAVMVGDTLNIEMSRKVSDIEKKIDELMKGPTEKSPPTKKAISATEKEPKTLRAAPAKIKNFDFESGYLQTRTVPVLPSPTIFSQ